VFDVGAGEFLVIAIVAVLILGPDKLPKAISTLMSWVRVLRDQASRARSEIAAAADLDPTITDDIKQSVKDIAELHPRRLAASILTDDAVAQARPATPPAAPQRGAAGTPQPSIFDPDTT
jgi:sec-independent protein translocase protein TatB